METNFYKAIDREIVNRATKHFLENGGKIKTLPPQKVITKAIIFREDLVAYESIDDFML